MFHISDAISGKK